MSRRSTIRQAGSQIVAEFSEKNVTFMAAGIAYNAFISLAPVLVLLLLIASQAGGGLEARTLAVAERSLPGPIADLVQQVFDGEVATPGASVVSIVVFLWGTLKVFRGLDTAFSEIYETTGSNSFGDTLLDGVVVFVAMLLAILSTVGASAISASLADVLPVGSLLTPLVLVAGLVLAFLPMYYRFPDTEVTVRGILPGVVFAAVGWAGLQALFQVYLRVAGEGTGSFFGSVIVVITWLYFSGLVLLLGAVINAVIDGHSSGKAGGVGQGAMDHETRRKASMDQDEFAAYLRQFREELTGRYEGMRPTADERVAELHHPRGDVEVIEQVKPDDEETRWEVAFRWQGADDEPDRGTETGGD